VNRRHAVLGAALAIALGWSAWALTDDGAEVVGATARAPARAGADGPRQLAALAPSLPNGTAPPAVTPPDDDLELASRPAPPRHLRNLFGEYSYEAPKPKVEAPPAETPHAPPLPLTYAGRLVVDGQTSYLFNDGDNGTVVLALGADAGPFKLVEANGGQLVFLHGPTGDRVQVSIPEADGGGRRGAATSRSRAP
jgi:hypothetical protein